MAYNLSWFILCCFFLIDDFYFVDLKVVHLVFCYTRFII